jgi:hypothetical protein
LFFIIFFFYFNQQVQKTKNNKDARYMYWKNRANFLLWWRTRFYNLLDMSNKYYHGFRNMWGEIRQSEDPRLTTFYSFRRPLLSHTSQRNKWRLPTEETQNGTLYCCSTNITTGVTADGNKGASFDLRFSA